jgi:hypothetical protein
MDRRSVIVGEAHESSWSGNRQCRRILPTAVYGCAEVPCHKYATRVSRMVAKVFDRRSTDDLAP